MWYKGPLKTALKRKWGDQKKYIVVEDGDKKGFMSGKGIKAKEEAKIQAMTLAPRTPCWMPLDYAIWDEVLDRMMDDAPGGKESKVDFISRLETTAKNFPRSFVEKQIGKMKERIQGVIDALGYHPKKD